MRVILGGFRMLKKILLLSCLSLLLLTGISYSAIYSDYQLGTRPSSMGGAYVAVSDDVDAIYWNPAGLATLKSNEVSFMHSNVFDVGINQEYLSIVHPVGKGFGFGLAWLHHDADLNEGFRNSSKTNTWSDDLFVLGVGMKLKENLMMGLNIKRFIINTEITSSGSESGSGIGFDFSLLLMPKTEYVELDIKDIKYGLVLRNVATDFNNENPSIDYKLGVSALLFDKITVAGDLVLTEDDKEDKEFLFYFGADYKFNKMVNVRLGLNDGSFTTGIGFTYLEKFKFNYAFQSELSDVEEDNHKFSFAYMF